MVATQRWWKMKMGSRGVEGLPKQLQREHYPIRVTTSRSSVAGGETRRWKYNIGGRRGARMVLESRRNSCRERKRTCNSCEVEE